MTRPIRGVFSAAVAVTTTAVALPAAYLATISAAGLMPRERRRHNDTPSTRFTILVPAHDEEAVIDEALASFDRLDYPEALLAVHVVADNCNDHTAERVRASRWTVHERDDPGDPGKGPALNWLYERLLADDTPFDAAIIVDADTSLDPDFLRAMDDEFRRGASVAQGYYTVRNPEPSASASFRYAALACRHRLRPLGRTRLGGSSGLYGNGMMFERSVLETWKWSGHLVEDAELQNELLLHGTRVAFVDDAVLWAEIPDTTEAARTQNERWERGRIELVREYVPRLLRDLPGASGRRLAYADATLDHVTPPLSALVALQLASTSVAAIGSVLGHRASRVALVVNVASIGVVVAHTIAGLASAGADRRHVRALLGAPAQILWKARLWSSMLSGRRDVAWTRTARNPERGQS